MPPKVCVAACLTDGRRVCAIGCRGRRPRRPAGAWQTRVYGQPPGRADVYGVGCRGGIYPSRDACGSGNIRGASRTPPPTTGSLCVGYPGMGNTSRSRRPVGRPPYVPLFGLCVGRGDPTPPKFTWPLVQRMAAESAPLVVGGGVPDAPQVYGKRAFTGSHRAGHARPLPRGFGTCVTCITAVGRHAPMPPKVRVAACSTGCRASLRRPVGRPPYVPLLGSCVGRGDPTPPKVYVVTRSTDDHRVRAIGCRGRRPRRPAGAWQTRVYG